MENDLGPPAEDAMMTSEKRIEIGTTWPSYHSHSLQSADINANQALQQQQPAQPLQGSLDRPSSAPQQGHRNIIFLKGPQPSSNSNKSILKKQTSQNPEQEFQKQFTSLQVVPASAEPVPCEYFHVSAAGRSRSRLKLLCYFNLNCVSAGIQCTILSLWGTTANQGLLQLPFDGMERPPTTNQSTNKQVHLILNKYCLKIFLFRKALDPWISTTLATPSPPLRRAISALMKNPAFYSLGLSAHTKVEACRW